MKHALLNSEATEPRESHAPASGSLKPWRLLHVESEVVDAMKLKLALHERLPVDSQLQQVDSLAAAQECLATESFDAVLVGCTFDDPKTEQAVRALIQDAGGTPVVLLSHDSSTDAVMRAGRLGARDFFPKEKLTGEWLAERLWPIVVSGGGEAVSHLQERRKAGRYDLFASAVIVPVLADGRPGKETPASVVNISRLGIGVLVEQDPHAIPDLCVLGVEARDGQYCYATVEWRQRRLALPAVHLGGRFIFGADDPLDTRRLTPRFDPQRLRYTAPMDPALLQEWTTRGVLRARVVDRVKSCSECFALVSYRSGCPECGSFDTEPTRLIHHFACAHVGPVADFGASGLVCPKCRSRNLVVGADFEYIEGPHRCRECSWRDSEPTLITECMNCGKRADAQHAVEKDVTAYHVNRLDPLDFIQDAP